MLWPSSMEESFLLIIDDASGKELIETMVSRRLNGEDYRGMYCAVLSINSVVVSAGLLRVLGPEAAELPLIATSTCNQGKGFFHALCACIMELLADLRIKSIVLPATEQSKPKWTDHFGFIEMTPYQFVECASLGLLCCIC